MEQSSFATCLQKGLMLFLLKSVEPWWILTSTGRRSQCKVRLAKSWSNVKQPGLKYHWLLYEVYVKFAVWYHKYCQHTALKICKRHCKIVSDDYWVVRYQIAFFILLSENKMWFFINCFDANSCIRSYFGYKTAQELATMLSTLLSHILIEYMYASGLDALDMGDTSLWVNWHAVIFKD